MIGRWLEGVAWKVFRPLIHWSFRPFNIVHHYALYLQGIYGRPTERVYWR